jgi:hypothetical protein
MNISYDYEGLLNELKSDLTEGLIEMDGMIKVVRDKKASESQPIIDYYYYDNDPREAYEEIEVADVLKEMEKYSRIVVR